MRVILKIPSEFHMYLGECSLKWFSIITSSVNMLELSYDYSFITRKARVNCTAGEIKNWRKIGLLSANDNESNFFSYMIRPWTCIFVGVLFLFIFPVDKQKNSYSVRFSWFLALASHHCMCHSVAFRKFEEITPEARPKNTLRFARVPNENNCMLSELLIGSV